MANYASPLGAGLTSIGDSLMQIMLQRETKKRQDMLDRLNQQRYDAEQAGRAEDRQLQRDRLAAQQESDARDFSERHMREDNARAIREQQTAAKETADARSLMQREGFLASLSPEQRRAVEAVDMLGPAGVKAIAPPEREKPETYNVGGDLYERTPDGSYRKVVAGYREPKTDPAAKPLTEGQAVAAGFADRMAQNASIISGYEQAAADFTNRQGWLPNVLRGEDYQNFTAAKRNWISANLRKESGAAISSSEYDNADLEYFPQPGDAAKVVDAKRQRRTIAEQSMRRAAGPAGATSSPTADTSVVRWGRDANGRPVRIK